LKGALRPYGHSTERNSTAVRSDLDETLRARLDTLCAEGSAIWDRFDIEIREKRFHPFVAADYEVVLDALLRHRRPGLRFLEWGSATGVIVIMADLLGYEAYGIELDQSLVATARDLTRRFQSGARCVAGSFLPTGYRWRASNGDARTGTLGVGESGYLQLGHALDEFDVVFGFPWDGEEPIMLDLMKAYGRPGALLLLNSLTDGVRAYRDGREVTGSNR
jgi:hypothetical protein